MLSLSLSLSLRLSLSLSTLTHTHLYIYVLLSSSSSSSKGNSIDTHTHQYICACPHDHHHHHHHQVKVLAFAYAHTHKYTHGGADWTMVIVVEMETAPRIQILDEFFCISNKLCKYIYTHTYTHIDTQQYIYHRHHPQVMVVRLTLFFYCQSFFQQLVLADKLDCSQCTHKANVCKSLPIGQHWCVHV